MWGNVKVNKTKKFISLGLASSYLLVRSKKELASSITHCASLSHSLAFSPHTYRARCLILRLFLCKRRTRFLRHFHLIFALAFFQGFDLCAIFLLESLKTNMVSFAYFSFYHRCLFPHERTLLFPQALIEISLVRKNTVLKHPLQLIRTIFKTSQQKTTRNIAVWSSSS